MSLRTVNISTQDALGVALSGTVKITLRIPYEVVSDVIVTNKVVTATLAAGLATVALQPGSYLFTFPGNVEIVAAVPDTAGPHDFADLIDGPTPVVSSTALKAANNLSDVADAATARTNLGAQASDADLTAIAGLAPANDDLIQRKAGAWTNRTPAQVKSDLALVKGDVGLGNVDNTSDAGKPVSTAQQTALDAKGDKDLTLNAQTGTSYTLALTDDGRLVTLSNSSAITLTVPPNSSVAFPVGTQIAIAQLGAGQVTVAPGSGVTVNSRGAALKLNAQYAIASLVKVATDTWILSGDVTT